MHFVINTKTMTYIVYYIILINKIGYLKCKNQFKLYFKTYTRIQSISNSISGAIKDLNIRYLLFGGSLVRFLFFIKKKKTTSIFRTFVKSFGVQFVIF